MVPPRSVGRIAESECAASWGPVAGTLILETSIFCGPPEAPLSKAAIRYATPLPPTSLTEVQVELNAVGVAWLAYPGEHPYAWPFIVIVPALIVILLRV